MMLGFNLENRTSSDFRVQMAARYLVVRRPRDPDRNCASTASSGRIRPLVSRFTVRFLAPGSSSARTRRRRSSTLDFIQDDRIVGQYSVQQQYMGGDVGVSLSHESEVSGGSAIRPRGCNGAGRAIRGCRKPAALKTSSGSVSFMMGRTARSCRRAARRRSLNLTLLRPVARSGGR